MKPRTRTLGRAAVAALLIGGLAAGCTSSGGRPQPGASATSPAGGLELSVRGNVLAPVGREVGPIAAPSGNLRLTVDSIAVMESCPGRGTPTQEPVFGHFVVLEVTASRAAPEDEAAAGADEPGYVGLGAERFRIAGPDGTVQEITSTQASWACFEDAELLPAFVDVGRTASGKVVLDSASEHGSVVFSQESSPGWEWSF